MAKSGLGEKRKRATNIKVLARRTKLKLMIDLGYSTEQMARELKCSVPTVKRDLAALRADPEFKIAGPAAEEALQKLLISNSAVKERLWAIALSADTPDRVRLQALEDIATLNERIGKLMHMYGLIPANMMQQVIAEPGSMVQVNMTRQDLAIVLADLLEGVPEEWQRFILDKGKALGEESPESSSERGRVREGG